MHMLYNTPFTVRLPATGTLWPSLSTACLY